MYIFLLRIHAVQLSGWVQRESLCLFLLVCLHLRRLLLLFLAEVNRLICRPAFIYMKTNYVFLRSGAEEEATKKKKKKKTKRKRKKKKGLEGWIG